MPSADSSKRNPEDREHIIPTNQQFLLNLTAQGSDFIAGRNTLHGKLSQMEAVFRKMNPSAFSESDSQMDN